MLDQERIDRYPEPGIDALPERSLGLLRGPGPNDAKTVRDPVHVSIDRDRRDAVAEDEDAVRGLGADPGERGELLEGPGDDPVEALEELARARSDHAGLDAVESGRPDEPLDLGGASVAERGSVREPRE